MSEDVDGGFSNWIQRAKDEEGIGGRKTEDRFVSRDNYKSLQRKSGELEVCSEAKKD